MTEPGLLANSAFFRFLKIPFFLVHKRFRFRRNVEFIAGKPLVFAGITLVGTFHHIKGLRVYFVVKSGLLWVIVVY